MVMGGMVDRGRVWHLARGVLESAGTNSQRPSGHGKPRGAVGLHGPAANAIARWGCPDCSIC